jgi:hypothetical protein
MPDKRSEDKKPTGWDYSSHPLRDGGAQIIAMAVAVVLFVVVPALAILYFWIAQHSARR